MKGKNQCDGCNRNLPVKNGIHTTKNGELIGCDINRYKKESNKKLHIADVNKKKPCKQKLHVTKSYTLHL